MDAERIIRFTIPGWFFIFSLVFHYWAVGGEFKHFDFFLFFDNNIKAILSFLAALASSPALGLVTASIGNRTLHLFLGRKLLFKIPTKEKEKEYNRYIDALWINLPNLRQEVWALESKLRGSTNASRENIKELHLLFNLVLRMKSPSDLSKFVLRRWNIFWMHINIISAIVLGGLFALFLRQYFEGICFWSYEIIWGRFLLEIPVIIYFVFAISHLREAREEAVEIEFKWLLNTVTDLRLE